MVFRLGWLILGTSAAITNRVPNLSNNNIARDDKQQIEREREKSGLICLSICLHMDNANDWRGDQQQKQRLGRRSRTQFLDVFAR